MCSMAYAGAELPAGTQLPLVENGSLVFYKQPISYYSDTCTSLPSLPSYQLVGSGRRRWGEDEAIEQAGFQVANSGFAKHRHNFEACHPVEEPFPVIYDAYRFPKAMVQNLSTIHSCPISTVRRMPRNPTAAVFPRNEETRTNRAGVPLLGENTRHALAAYNSHLYKTTSHDTTFQDTSDYMLKGMHRDNLYMVEGPRYIEEQSCSRVVNHPDPCNHCWPNGDVTPRPALPNKSSRPYYPVGRPKFECNHSDDASNANALCSRCDRIDCLHKDHCLHIPMMKNGISELCKHLLDPAKCNVCANERLTQQNSTRNGESDMPESLRLNTPPGLETTRNNQDHDVHQSGYTPSNGAPRHQSQTVEGLSLSSRAPRWLSGKFGDIDPYSWEAIQGARPQRRRPAPSMASTDLWTSTSRLSGANTWSYRDRNNIRLPSVSAVLGTLDKTSAQARYHRLYPDSIPDLRDNHKYSKRVSFFGYNSSVYR